MARAKTHLDNTIVSIGEAAFAEAVNSPKRAAYLFKRINHAYPSSHFFRRAVEALIDSLLSRATRLLLLGQFEAVYIDLYACLERLSFVALSKRIACDKKAVGVLFDLLARKNLSDFAASWVAIRVWSEDDVKVIARITKIRNGLAHWNDQLLDKALGAERASDTSGRDARFRLENVTTDFITTISLCLKMTRGEKTGTWYPIS